MATARKLILQMQMSVDGFVEAADPELDWQLWDWGEHCPWDEALRRDFNRVFRTVDCLLLSRNLAEQGFLTHWGDAVKNHPREPLYDFARKVTAADKVVFSRRLEISRWARTEIATGGLVKAVQALKRRAGKDMIAFGGVTFAASLAAAGLVDEFQFYVNPAVVGSGRSIFREGIDLRLLKSTAYRCGMVVNRYAPV